MSSGTTIVGPRPAAPSGAPLPLLPVGAHSPYAAGQGPAGPFGIAAFVLAGISVLAVPIVAGPLAVILAAVGLYRKERFAGSAILFGVAGTVAGIALSML